MQLTSSKTRTIESVELTREGQGHRLKIRIRVEVPFRHTNGKPFSRFTWATVSFPVRSN